MIEKIKRPQQFNNQEMQIPRNIQELMQRYDLNNKDIRDYLDFLITKVAYQEEIEKLKEKNILTVGLEGNLDFTSTANYQRFNIPLTKEMLRVGDILKVSKGKVIIPAGVSKVLVSAQCVSNGGSITYGLNIMKNGLAIYQSYTAPSNQTFNSLAIPTGGIEVTEGDIISLDYYINNSGYSRTVIGDSGHRTYLTIEVVE